MKKYYSEPDVEIRNYSFNPSDSVFTVSHPETGSDGEDIDLGKDDIHDGDDIFGN